MSKFRTVSVKLAGPLFCLAVFAWGFGFYGQSVYLAALRATRGWSATLISGATTTFYLCGAVLLALVPRAIERLGSRGVAISGALLLGAGTILLSYAAAPWQLYASVLVMGEVGAGRLALETPVAIASRIVSSTPSTSKTPVRPA